jgi:predicted nuclease of predicted toxin-antitoxin system
VRLLLDANLSPKRIGSALQRRGHDVLNLASDAALGALDDPQVLELAAEQDRILVTRNARDFAPILREWAEAGRHHAGCILIWTLGHHEFGAIISGVTRLLRDRPEPAEWRDLAVAL